MFRQLGLVLRADQRDGHQRQRAHLLAVESETHHPRGPAGGQCGGQCVRHRSGQWAQWGDRVRLLHPGVTARDRALLLH